MSEISTSRVDKNSCFPFSGKQLMILVKAEGCCILYVCQSGGWYVFGVCQSRAVTHICQSGGMLCRIWCLSKQGSDTYLVFVKSEGLLGIYLMFVKAEAWRIFNVYTPLSSHPPFGAQRRWTDYHSNRINLCSDL